MELMKAERELLRKAADCEWGTRTLATGEKAAAVNLEQHGLGEVVGDPKALTHFRINERGRQEVEAG